ncbi:MAG TPA: phosphotransferase [Acidimicrobiales bacterium]|nr:phosphotransferase [Acidimicrobiales bacterium]
MTGMEVLQRRRSARASSFALHTLRARGRDGSVLELVAKDLSPGSMLDEARRVRPEFLMDASREAGVYRHVLDPDRHGTPRCVAVEEGTAGPVLVLEHVRGAPLEELATGPPWLQAGRWLASFQTERFAGPEPGPEVGLLVYDDTYFARWPERAVEITRRQGHAAAADIAALHRSYDAVTALLRAQPRVLVHGDFHPSNIVVSEDDARICVVDWEMAGRGPVLLDLAALTSGAWKPARRDAVVQAYRDALGGNLADWAHDDAFAPALEACRMHLAMQWLGWAVAWEPEPRRRYDWAAVALDSARRLGM